jgi:DNA-binding response OmpR family regulator
MTRLLVVERREHPRAAALLEAEGFTVVTAIQQREAAIAVDSFRPDGILVEAVSPSTAVLELCAGLRNEVAVPLMLLCGPSPERDAVAAFGAGVDSLVVEPVGRHELVARMRALIRRAPAALAPDADRITVGPIVLDAARRELFVNGELVRVPRREFDIAEILMRDAGRVVTRQRIVHELWGSLRDTKSLDVQVGRLRTRLAAVEGWRRIVTVRGVGFRLLVDDEPAPPAPAVVRLDAATRLEIELAAPRSDAGVEMPDDVDPELLEGSASA